MLEDLSDRAIQGPEKAREAPALREWVKDRVNRKIVLDMARLWDATAGQAA
jgi:hypothetical protein